jgi:hypothetical protein
MGKSAPGGLTGGSCCAGSAGSGTWWTGEEDLEVDVGDVFTLLMCKSSEVKESGVIKVGRSCRESASAVAGTCRL